MHWCLESIGFQWQHPLDYTDRILYYNPTYMAVQLIIYQGICYLRMEQFLALEALMGLLDILGLLVSFLPLFRTLWFRTEDYCLVVYREVGTIPEELLLGQGRVFSV
jgi:hypothetical protein